MCSLTINATADGILGGHNEKDKKMIEKRMIAFAKEASVEKSGALDISTLKRMPEELKDLRKWTIGRHRVYYVGHHTRCNYRIIHIKSFKKTGVDDENDKHFQNALAKIIDTPEIRTLELPQTQSPPAAQTEPSTT